MSAVETDWADEAELRVLDAAIALAPTLGWNSRLAAQAGAAAGLSAGETGAAAGLLALATTAFFVEKRVIAGPGVCLFTSEDTWRGAAIVVAYPRRSKRRAHA